VWSYRPPRFYLIIATRDPNDAGSIVRYEKTISNLKEVKARSGKVIALATEGDEEIKERPRNPRGEQRRYLGR
jgi:glucosamine 6-phosphate synthetase-like amidotransferase/phosphosugar isomerase protein